MKTVKILSPKGTPKEDILFVIEEPTVSRNKMRLVDVEKNLAEEEAQVNSSQTKITELKKLKKDMKELLK